MGIREIPGLGLIILAAFLMHLPQSHRAFISLILMGIGYGAHALVDSYSMLIAVALIGSIGFHNWMPLQSSIGLGLVNKNRAGQVLGRLNALGSLASMGGMLVIVFFSKIIGHRPFFVFGGTSIVLAAFIITKLPRNIGADTQTIPRLLLRKRYWLFYVLTFLEGSRTQIFHTFGAWVLVYSYGFNAQKISLLLIISSAINFLISPKIGKLIDRFGERWMLAGSYFFLVIHFIGYAIIHDPWILSGVYISINFLMIFRLGLQTFINRITTEEELSPTLSAGITINHITSVGMSLIAGTLLKTTGYEELCWGAAGIILISIPFALAIKTIPEKNPDTPQE